MRQLRFTIVCLVSVGAVVPALAQGCGPTRLKVSETITLDRSPADAWAMVGDFQNLNWDTEVVSVRGSGGNVPDAALRTLALKSGAALSESLYKYDATAMSYAYHLDRVDVGKLPIQNASATLEVLPAANSAKSLVRWKFVFYRNLAPGEGSPDEADAKAVEAMRHFMRAGLGGLQVAPRT